MSHCCLSVQNAAVLLISWTYCILPLLSCPLVHIGRWYIPNGQVVHTTSLLLRASQNKRSQHRDKMDLSHMLIGVNIASYSKNDSLKTVQHIPTVGIDGIFSQSKRQNGWVIRHNFDCSFQVVKFVFLV